MELMLQYIIVGHFENNIKLHYQFHPIPTSILLFMDFDHQGTIYGFPSDRWSIIGNFAWIPTLPFVYYMHNNMFCILFKVVQVHVFGLHASPIKSYNVFDNYGLYIVVLNAL